MPTTSVAPVPTTSVAPVIPTTQAVTTAPAAAESTIAPTHAVTTSHAGTSGASKEGLTVGSRIALGLWIGLGFLVANS